MQEMIAKPNHGGRSRCNLWKISLHMAERATVEEFVIQSRSESYVYIYVILWYVFLILELRKQSVQAVWWERWLQHHGDGFARSFLGGLVQHLSAKVPHCCHVWHCMDRVGVEDGSKSEQKKTIDRYMIYDSIYSIVQLTMTSSLTLSLKLLFALLARACLSSQSLTLIHPCLVRQLSRLDVWRATYVITQLLTMTPSHSMTMDRTMCVCVCWPFFRHLKIQHDCSPSKPKLDQPAFIITPAFLDFSNRFSLRTLLMLADQMLYRSLGRKVVGYTGTSSVDPCFPSLIPVGWLSWLHVRCYDKC